MAPISVVPGTVDLRLAGSLVGMGFTKSQVETAIGKLSSEERTKPLASQIRSALARLSS
jgi:Holliday junction resolvasome RuvABC DNA-binding subunit